MRPPRERLVGLLADGGLHSGAALAAALEVSRTTIWKLVADLRQRGVEIESLNRRGYRLPQAVELLDPAAIRGAAAAAQRRLPADLAVLFETDSTNALLHAAPPPPAGHPRLVFAELQHAGRGRRGRAWLAPFGSGLTFSIAWTFAETPADLPSLSLAMGVQVARALQTLGAGEVGLKWPNDIVHAGHKLGGLLAQLRTEAGGPVHAVIGLGLNLQLPETLRLRIDTPQGMPAGDIADLLGGLRPGRNRAAALIAATMLEGLEQFAHEGFAPFLAPWNELDALQGAAVRVDHAGGRVDGVAFGTERDGALRLVVNGQVERVYSGEVSLRRLPDAVT